jgi:hypothetical protein
LIQNGVDSEGRANFVVDRPAIAIVIELEETTPEIITPADSGDRQRLVDWVRSQPELLLLFDFAMRAADGPDWQEKAVED